LKNIKKIRGSNSVLNRFIKLPLSKQFGLYGQPLLKK